jgi:outer membrane protein
MGAYYPTLVLFGSGNSRYSDASIRFSNPTAPYPFFDQFKDNFNQSIGLSLQIPIFNRFATRTSVRKARIQFENAQVNTQISKNNLSKVIIQAVLDVQAANKKLASNEQTYQANKEAFNVIQQRYNVGLVNSLDYNTSLTNLNKSQFDLIQARYELIFRSKVIDYYLGNPITL